MVQLELETESANKRAKQTHEKYPRQKLLNGLGEGPIE